MVQTEKKREGVSGDEKTTQRQRDSREPEAHTHKAAGENIPIKRGL